MGLLDYYDPEVVSAMGEYGVSPQAKNQAKNNALMNAGFAMLASNGLGATRNQSLGRALGAGGMAGMHTYNSSIEDAQQQQARQMQLAGSLEKMMQQRKKAEMLAQFRGSLPEQDRQLFDVAPEDYVKTMPQFQKPQLVETADPSEPLRTVKKWMKPGETEGSVAGYGTLPEILDPRVQGAKRSIAKAGAPNINVNAPYEPAFNKELAALDAKALDKMRGGAEAGNQVLSSAARLRQLNPAVYSNGGAEAKMAAVNMLAGLGINVGDAGKLANSQEFDALSSKLVMDSLGGTLGAGVSNADVQFLRKTVPNIGQDPKARDALINFMEKKAKGQIETYSAARQYAEKNNGLKGWKAPTFVDTSAIPKGAINELKMRKSDSNARAQFDEIYGQGAADSILGGK